MKEAQGISTFITALLQLATEPLLLQSVIQVWIINCKFTLVPRTECHNIRGCAIYAKGSFWSFHLKNKDLLLSTCTHSRIFKCSTLYIENSVFAGSLGDNGGLIHCENMDLELVNCYFSLTENRKISADGGFIYYRNSYRTFTAANVPFDASEVQSNTFISIMELRSEEKIFRNTQIICPKSLGVLEKTRKLDSGTNLHHCFCQKHCTDDEYTYQAGSTIISSTSHREGYREFINVTSSANNLSCYSCPIGTNCTNHIQALPNYWGYKDKYDIVSMIRCPYGYCCQEEKTCTGIDSCHVNRIGPLCGRCKAKWSESLFSAECLLVDDCPAALILVFYVIGVIAYGSGLMAISCIKDVGPALAKKIWKAATEKVLCRRGKTQIKMNSKILNCQEQKV